MLFINYMTLVDWHTVLCVLLLYDVLCVYIYTMLLMLPLLLHARGKIKSYTSYNKAHTFLYRKHRKKPANQKRNWFTSVCQTIACYFSFSPSSVFVTLPAKQFHIKHSILPVNGFVASIIKVISAKKKKIMFFCDVSFVFVFCVIRCA